MAWPIDWTDEQFDDRRVSLDAILTTHLGPMPETPHALDAEYVMMPLWLPAHGLDAMNKKLERDKITKVEKLASQIAEVWTSLHPTSRNEMNLLSYYLFEAEGKFGKFQSAHPLSLDILTVLDGIINSVSKHGLSIIEKSDDIGRRNILNISMIGRLRDVWIERKQSSPPDTLNEVGPFADFLRDSFETLGLPGNIRAAMDSWRAFRAKRYKSE